MKKSIFLLFICLIFIPCVYAQDAWRMPDRGFEIGLNANAGFSNNFLNAFDIFQETIIIDLDKLKDGFNFNMDFGLVPFYFQYNNKDYDWGFGLSLKTDFYGIFALSGDILSFAETENNKDTNISGAMFLEANLNAYFPIWKFKVKAAPSAFLPVVYIDSAESFVSYTNVAANGGETKFNLLYDVYLYTPISLQPFFSAESPDNLNIDYTGIFGMFGFDINFGLEFPLGEALGLTKTSNLLNFTLGLDVYNFPILPAKIQNYTRYSGQIGSDEPFNIFGNEDVLSVLLGEDEMSLEPEFGTVKEFKEIYRPIKINLWVDWKPFGDILTFTPVGGVSIYRTLDNDKVLLDPVFDYGLKARLDLGNIFILSFGTGYFDSLWKNSLDITLNFRLLEINVGIDLRAPDFIESWKGAGVGVNVGLKFGW